MSGARLYAQTLFLIFNLDVGSNVTSGALIYVPDIHGPAS